MAKHIVVLTLEVEAENREGAIDEIVLCVKETSTDFNVTRRQVGLATQLDSRLSHSVKVAGMTVYEITANTLFE